MLAVPNYVPEKLLTGEIPELPDRALGDALESQLVKLNSWEARIEFVLGGEFAKFTLPEVKELGHAKLEEFARARLGFTWSHARELIKIRKQLEDLPLLRRVYLLGELRRSRLREILRVVTPETQAEWLLLARSLDAKELRRRVRAGALDAGLDDVAKAIDDEDTVRVAVALTPRERVHVDCVGLPMLRSVLGQDGPLHELMHALAAETLTDRPIEPTHQDGDVDDDCDGGSCKSKRVSPARARRQAQRVLGRVGGEARVALPAPEGDSFGARLDYVLKLAQWKRAVDWQRARLLFLVDKYGTWAYDKRFTDITEWAWRRLGLAPREVVALRRLTLSMEGLDAIDAAWRDGRITTYRADRIARFASPDTATDWVRLAELASGKRFDAEIDAVKAMQVVLGIDGWKKGTDGGRPCWDLSMTDLRFRWADACEDAATVDVGGWCNSLHDPNQVSDGICGEPGWRVFAFHAPKATAEQFESALKLVAEQGRGTLDRAQCLLEMMRRFAAIHVSGHALEDRSLRARILRRDGWQCAMPHCRSRRHLEVHHIKFRSQLGTNHPGNLITLCSSCHHLLHEERVRISVLHVKETRAGVAPEVAVTVGEWAVFWEGIAQPALEAAA